MDISIVVIGRNEGFKLKKCFESINSCENELISNFNFQTIYVDSDSNDESLQIALQFNVDHILKIKGEINAAIARNVGARYAKYEWLFFIDGDMEIIPGFFENKITQNFLEKEHFFSGQFINIYYDSSWKKIGEDNFKANEKVETQWVPGGLFLVRKELWTKLGGMRDYYKKSQDFEFGLRCFKAGYPFKRINLLLVHHHTISYLNQTRIVEFLKKGYHLYARSLLYREHIFKSFNSNCFKLMIKQDYTIIFLLLSLLSIPLLKYYAILVYITPIFFKGLKSLPRRVFYFMIYMILRDLSVLFGIVLFHPNKNLQYQLEVIKG